MHFAALQKWFQVDLFSSPKKTLIERQDTLCLARIKTKNTAAVKVERARVTATLVKINRVSRAPARLLSLRRNATNNIVVFEALCRTRRLIAIIPELLCMVARESTEAFLQDRRSEIFNNVRSFETQPRRLSGTLPLNFFCRPFTSRSVYEVLFRQSRNITRALSQSTPHAAFG